MELSSGLIADYALDLEYGDIPDEAVTKAKRLVLDSVGCCLGGYASEPSKVVREVYETPVDAGRGATVVGSGTTVPTEYAALINSLMVRYLDYNDTYISEGRACHPSDHIPALLAVAEADEASGSRALTAIVLAYELEGAGLDTGALWDEGFDYVTWGIYSCTAAVGKLMGLDREELVSAIGIAGSASNALGIARRGDVTMWKGAAHSYVNHNAVQACQMARAGMTGPTDLFEGEAGVFEAMAGERIEAPPLGGRENGSFRVSETHVKPFACGYYMQSAITALFEVVEGSDLSPGDVAAIEVETFERAAEILASPEKWSKDLTRETADHSIPYTLAVGLLDGDVSPRQYRPERLRDERVHAIMDRVSVEVDPELTDYARSHPREVPMMVRVRTDDETLESRVNYPLGHAENPMTDKQIEAKMADMAMEYLSPGQVEAAVDTCYSLDELERVDPLLNELVV